MEAKLAKNIFFSVICSLLLLGGVLTAVFTISPNSNTNAFNSTYTETDNAVVVDEIWNGTTFDRINTQTLLNMLCNSSSGSIDTLSSNIGSGTINATTLRGYSSGGNVAGKSIVVTLGGFKWIVTYLFKDSSGNTCATLWMAAANGKSTYGNSSSYYGGSSFTSGYPGSMYGTSYVAVATLNNGGTYANITSNSAVTATSTYTSSSTHQYAAFTHSSGGIRPYIVQPNKVPYQTSSQGKSYQGTGYALMNESLGKVSTKDLYGSSYTYEALDGYTNWGDDYLWLPSMSETGYTGTGDGIWQTSQAERSNSSNTYSWSRSGHYSNSRSVYSLLSSGDSYAGNYSSVVYSNYAIRPALHLNLTKVSVSVFTATVTLNKESGSGGTSSITVTKGSAMPSITNPTRTGYTFGGYYTSTGGSGTQYYTATGASARTYPTSGGPTTLYAKWTANTYYVKYDANGGSGTMSNSTHTYDTASKLTANAFSRTGYTFLGWSTSNTATSATYANQASVSTLTTTAGGTVTLYAVWQANTYYVKYNGNGATSGSMANSTHIYDIESELTANAYTYLGYVFVGWAMTSDGKVILADKASISTLTDVADAIVELYAKWVPDTVSIYATQGGEVRLTGFDNTDTSSTVNIEAIPYAGYKFLSWSTSGGADLNAFTSAKIEVPFELVRGQTVIANFALSSGSTNVSTYKGEDSEVQVCVSKGGQVRAFGYDNADSSTKVRFAIKGIDAGYRFVGWCLYGSNSIISTEATYDFALSTYIGTHIIAKFEKIDNSNVNLDTSN